ncbi:MAG TPA: cupin domain-containing protein [Gammaproteobacteria bacterium]|nr:cupin domain-containing protein [Gammaproteobacteria bacterium]
MTSSRGTEPDTDPQRFERRALDADFAPLWTFFKEWFPAEPRVAGVPHLWRYDALRDLVMESAAAVSTADAERRVLVLENPGLRGRHLVTDALYAGLQLLMPGEIARPHRHTAAALRFIVEGKGAYTAVAGERAYMEPGDLIVTPSWAWHEHRNEGDGPTVWLDVLDVPLVRFLGAGFSEHYTAPEFPLAPRDTAKPPVFSYPYAGARESLERLRRRSSPDPHHGFRLEYLDATGAPAIPTISTHLQLVPQGFATQPYATTAGAVVAVVAGRGVARIGAGELARELAYAPRDLLAVPSWQPLELRAAEDTVLFSASDEAVQRRLGLLRERRG